MRLKTEDLERAAQIWGEPQHAHKVMDVAFAEFIAFALAEQQKRDAEIAKNEPCETDDPLNHAERIAYAILEGTP